MSTDLQVIQPSELQGSTQADIAELERMLTLKQRAFLNAWLGEAAGNGRNAARLAGYGDAESSPVALSVAATQVLNSTNVRAYLDAALPALGISPQALMLQLHEGIYNNAFEGIDLGNLTPSELGKLNSKLIKRITVTEADGANGTMRSVSIEPIDRAELIKLAMRAVGMDKPNPNIQINVETLKLYAGFDIADV